MQKQDHTQKTSPKACGGRAIKFGLILLLFSSCTVLKSKSILKSDSLTIKEEQQKTKLEVMQKQRTEMLYLYSDSAKYRSRVSIVPEGEFSYSLDKGFSGKASSLIISGDHSMWQNSAGASLSHNLLSRDSSATSTLKMKEKISRNEKLREVSSRGRGWMAWLSVLSLVAGCLALWFFGRRLFYKYILF
ncbi:hypothetical protein WG906_04275 [Pedobacter sp. P351]|uniref:hypothetical protein n=1 Tax=Pedobacter superstes TaxID=3133441 RepID=UPI0030B58F15